MPFERRDLAGGVEVVIHALVDERPAALGSATDLDHAAGVFVGRGPFEPPLPSASVPARCR